MVMGTLKTQVILCKLNQLLFGPFTCTFPSFLFTFPISSVEGYCKIFVGGRLIDTVGTVDALTSLSVECGNMQINGDAVWQSSWIIVHLSVQIDYL